MSENPCFNGGEDCPARKAGCHGSCAAYRAYRLVKDAELVRRRQDADARAVGADYHIRMKLNYLRKNRR